jgi:hypothetical protein
VNDEYDPVDFTFTSETRTITDAITASTTAIATKFPNLPRSLKIKESLALVEKFTMINADSPSGALAMGAFLTTCRTERSNATARRHRSQTAR